MRQTLLGVVFGGVALLGGSLWGQTHKVAKPESVVRAVGVYEWTGELAKPTASRLIPVALFIDNHLEDAGVYLARPIPFALLPGNVYLLQQSGIDKGTLDLAYARHLQTMDAAYDDGWFGYGSYKAPTVSTKKPPALRASKTVPVITTTSDKPHFSNKPAADGTTAGSSDSSAKTDSSAKADSSAKTKPDTASGSADDPDRPTMKRRSDSDAQPASTAGGSDSAKGSGTPADDPDRPTMKRHTGDTTADADKSSTAGKSGDDAPADDPDRPTLKRHSVEDAKKAQRKADETASVTGASTSLNDDPNRPNLHRGKPVSAMTEADLPKLSGLPPDLHQMVAVSDAANREPHDFARSWEDVMEHARVLAKMQEMARAQLAAYGGAAAPAVAPPASAPAKRVPASRSKRVVKPVAAPTVALLDEQLKGYTLSYGGAPTYVYMAHTAGTGAELRYVTVVAQDDGLGELKMAMQGVTDAAHLDRTARMRFVDVVDVEANNRASLLFERRSQSARQFEVYRVIAARAEQIFSTGTTQ